MIRVGDQGVHSPRRRKDRPLDLHQEWAELFGLGVAEQLTPDRRYSLIRIGVADFAFSDTDHYLRALGQAWDAGLVPDPRPSALGSELGEAAPNLLGVDCDLGELTRSDVEPPPGRFS
jgi:hypothetical protein